MKLKLTKHEELFIRTTRKILPNNSGKRDDFLAAFLIVMAQCRELTLRLGSEKVSLSLSEKCIAAQLNQDEFMDNLCMNTLLAAYLMSDSEELFNSLENLTDGSNN